MLGILTNWGLRLDCFDCKQGLACSICASSYSRLNLWPWAWWIEQLQQDFAKPELNLSVVQLKVPQNVSHVETRVLCNLVHDLSEYWKANLMTWTSCTESQLHTISSFLDHVYTFVYASSTS